MLRTALFYIEIGVLVGVLGSAAFGWIVWHSGLASMSLRKDIVRLWRLVSVVRRWLIAGGKVVLGILLVLGGLGLGIGWSANDRVLMLHGGVLLAMFGILFWVNWREA